MEAGYKGRYEIINWIAAYSYGLVIDVNCKWNYKLWLRR